MSASRFEDLAVWQRAHELALATYRLTTGFPRAELYGMTNQMRRSAVSVPANIAEGFARATAPDKARHYNIARASLEELRYYLILSNDLGYAETTELQPKIETIGRMLTALIKSILAPPTTYHLPSTKNKKAP